jgi:hypothetical protein
MVNPITGEMSFEERTKESWKIEESKDKAFRMKKEKTLEIQRPEVEEPFDYFIEKAKQTEKF